MSVYLFIIKTETIAKKAPVEFAKTSKTSAFLVSVQYCCINSIDTPKTKENKKA